MANMELWYGIVVFFPVAHVLGSKKFKTCARQSMFELLGMVLACFGYTYIIIYNYIYIYYIYNRSIWHYSSFNYKGESAWMDIMNPWISLKTRATWIVCSCLLHGFSGIIPAPPVYFESYTCLSAISFSAAALRLRCRKSRSAWPKKRGSARNSTKPVGTLSRWQVWEFDALDVSYQGVSMCFFVSFGLETDPFKHPQNPSTSKIIPLPCLVVLWRCNLVPSCFLTPQIENIKAPPPKWHMSNTPNLKDHAKKQFCLTLFRVRATTFLKVVSCCPELAAFWFCLLEASPRWSVREAEGETKVLALMQRYPLDKEQKDTTTESIFLTCCLAVSFSHDLRFVQVWKHVKLQNYICLKKSRSPAYYHGKGVPWRVSRVFLLWKKANKHVFARNVSRYVASFWTIGPSFHAFPLRQQQKKDASCFLILMSAGFIGLGSLMELASGVGHNWLGAERRWRSEGEIRRTDTENARMRGIGQKNCFQTKTLANPWRFLSTRFVCVKVYHHDHQSPEVPGIQIHKRCSNHFSEGQIKSLKIDQRTPTKSPRTCF